MTPSSYQEEIKVEWDADASFAIEEDLCSAEEVSNAALTSVEEKIESALVAVSS